MPLLPRTLHGQEGGERFDIFIVPVGREPNGIRYEAIFF